MRTGHQKKGFTLIEVIIAAAIIVSILSMLYGTYFTIARSTKAARSKQALSQQAQKTITQLARQIRCSYAATHSRDANKTGDRSRQKTEDTKKRFDYFSGNANHLTEILHLVTTNSFTASKDSPEGLFEVIYKFNKNEGVLYLNQEQFVGVTKKTVKKQWIPIAENIHSLELKFFDGRLWSNKWIYKERQKLPDAVEINIAFEDQNGRTYECNTVANVYCASESDRKTQVADSRVANNK